MNDLEFLLLPYKKEELHSDKSNLLTSLFDLFITKTNEIVFTECFSGLSVYQQTKCWPKRRPLGRDFHWRCYLVNKPSAGWCIQE